MKYASSLQDMISYQSASDDIFRRFAKKVDFGNASCLILGI